MEIFSKENGLMIKLMVMEYISMQMEPVMKDIGRMIYRMDMVLNHGQIVQNMKVIIKKDKSMAKEHMYGVMVQHMRAIGRTIKLQDK